MMSDICVFFSTVSRNFREAANSFRFVTIGSNFGTVRKAVSVPV